MSNEKEVAVIPMGTSVSIMGCRFTLLEDVEVEANQTDLDSILKEQQDWLNQPKIRMASSDMLPDL
ncbi:MULTISPECIES: hypothetical protein [unclassified Acinetobacter]|uniref:hypothetical protein n=1 Tax=unclassified Acinetobacter TaxID=196816 RepID=UPI001F4AC265|nr:MULTISPECIES: hypothetical protein [unclassified Acinetobacter]MCH7353307.1 hypothetical protein [Acinetobacter sp. NIPH 2023]MCH7360689.1 hypothetical protein [Acinetobacter sp. NIPH 2024]